MLIIYTNSPLLKFKGTWHQHSLVHSSAQLICLSKVQLISQSHWFLVDVCLWCLFPHRWLECIQLISVRGPLSPPLFPGNLSGICVISFEEGGVIRGRGTGPWGWHICPGQELLSPHVLVLSPEFHCSLDLQCPISWNLYISLWFAYVLVYISLCLSIVRHSCNRALARIKLFTHLKCNVVLWQDHRPSSIPDLWNKVEPQGVRLWRGVV